MQAKGGWGEVVKTFVWAIVIAMIFRSFVFQPFHIPSGSMKPTLLIGDYLIVSKYSYGYSNQSFPFSPNIIDDRIWYTEPKRGDIIVFRVPGQEWDKDIFIKRLIGLPGDTIQMKQGILFINGKQVDLVEDGQFVDHDKARGSYSHAIAQLIETLPNGIKHKVLNDEDDSIADNTEERVIPEDYFFMMGDNRDNSTDSRFPVPGLVPKKNLIGRAEIILLSSDGSFFNPLDWRMDRFFTWLR